MNPQMFARNHLLQRILTSSVINLVYVYSESGQRKRVPEVRNNKNKYMGKSYVFKAMEKYY